MNSKFKQILVSISGAVAMALLVTLSAQHIEREPAPAPQIRPASGFARENRVIPQPITNPALVGEEATITSTPTTPPTEIYFEPQKSSDSPATSPHKDAQRDNPTPTPTPPQNTVSITATEPKMGDTRTVDGQKQVYFLGFGWIEDNDEPNVGIYAADMYENGNKIGEMGGGAFVDGEGDINKMVGVMD